FGKMLTSTLKNAWFRTEYLQWTISKPGPILLGEQVFGGVPISNSNTGGPIATPLGAGVNFAQSVNSITGTAQSPSLDGLTIQNSNGFRGTFGMPVPVGQFEVSGFVLATNSSEFNGNNLIQPQIMANRAVTIGNAAGQVGPKLGTNGLPATNGQI